MKLDPLLERPEGGGKLVGSANVTVKDFFFADLRNKGGKEKRKTFLMPCVVLKAGRKKLNNNKK